MNKFFRLLTLLLSLVFASNNFPVFAMQLKIDNLYVKPETTPYQNNGTTLVPLRIISENIGAKVSWNQKDKRIVITKDNQKIILAIDSNIAYVNDTMEILSSAPQIKNNVTMVPIRFISENLNCTVTFVNNIVSVISSKNNIASTEYFQYKNKSYKIIEVDGGDRSGIRQKNVAVDIGFGNRVYWGLTNEYGQLVYVIADKIILQDDKTEPVNSSGRYYNDEANVPGTERADLDQGHVIADSLGGVSNAYNITPQNSTLNRYGDQAYMEKAIRAANGCTDFIATITYPNTSTQIPSSYRYEYTIKGNRIVDEFKNENPESTGDKKNETTSTPTLKPTNPLVTIPNEKEELARIDTNGNGKVTIKEATAAGYKMPIYSTHWLYKYMDDRDGDGVVGE